MIVLKKMAIIVIMRSQLSVTHICSFLFVIELAFSIKRTHPCLHALMRPGLSTHGNPCILYGAAGGKDGCMLGLSIFGSVVCVHGLGRAAHRRDYRLPPVGPHRN
jgi:hypothetical protein